MAETRAKITGTGSYAPEKVLTNHDLEKIVDTTDEWIASRTGIKERRITEGDDTADIAVNAAKAALKAAGTTARDIDLIVVGTVTPDMVFPSTACFVQARLGVKAGVPAFDVAAACSGFLYAMDVAEKYIRTGTAKKALVIGADLFSRILDWKDRTTCVLFGDGAGAVVLSQTRGKAGILSSTIHSDGKLSEYLYATRAIPKSLFEHGGGEKGTTPPQVKMRGNETFKVAVRTMVGACKKELEMNGLKVKDVSLVIPHQANIRIINAIKDRLRLSDEQVFTNIERYGNTSSASIPIALDEAVREKRIKSGDNIIFVAFGGGFTWASATVRW